MLSSSVRSSSERVKPALHRLAQYRHGGSAVGGRTEHVGAGQLHCAVIHASHGQIVGEAERSAGKRFSHRHSFFLRFRTRLETARVNSTLPCDAAPMMDQRRWTEISDIPLTVAAVAFLIAYSLQVLARPKGDAETSADLR